MHLKTSFQNTQGPLGFSGGPVVRSQCFHCRAQASILIGELRPHKLWGLTKQTMPQNTKQTLEQQAGDFNSSLSINDRAHKRITRETEDANTSLPWHKQNITPSSCRIKLLDQRLMKIWILAQYQRITLQIAEVPTAPLVPLLRRKQATVILMQGSNWSL